MALKNLAGSLLKSALSSTNKTNSKTKVNLDDGFGLDDIESLAKGIMGGSTSKSTKKTSGTTSVDMIKMLANMIRNNDGEKDGGLLDNAEDLFKALMNTKTETSKNADKSTLDDELDILKKILPAKLSTSNMTTIVKKVIASLTPKKQTENNVLAKLSSMNITGETVKDIVSSLLG
ncbi:MAG: hypothetical protein GX220_03600 [Treponema sp.]|mgnify:CR=1 FL=1|nr:hypothetical protein [Treponema sp.]